MSNFTLSLPVHPAFTATLLAGLATGLGGVLAVIFRPTPRLLAACAGFAGGVMFTVSLGDLTPAALAAYAQTLPPLAAGAAVVGLLALGMVSAILLGALLPSEAALAAKLTRTPKQVGHPTPAAQSAGAAHRAAALRTALLICLALVLHNLPEGVLTLFAGLSNPALGARTALAIALHNIPEGLAVAVPFAYATRSRAKGALAALGSGLAEPFGAVVAWFFLRSVLTPGLLNGTMVWVAGIMLWVAIGQLLPTALAPAHATAGAAGVAAGCLSMLLGIAALG